MISVALPQLPFLHPLRIRAVPRRASPRCCPWTAQALRSARTERSPRRGARRRSPQAGTGLDGWMVSWLVGWMVGWLMIVGYPLVN
jgi:hypothetical protein